MNELTKKMDRQIRMRNMLVMMICFALTLTIGIGMNMSVAYCDNNAAKEATDSINAAWNALADNAYNVLKNGIMPTAGLAMCIAAFCLVFRGQKGMNEAMTIAGTCAVGVALVFMAPLLIKAFGGWFVEHAGNMSDVNGLFSEYASVDPSATPTTPGA